MKPAPPAARGSDLTALEAGASGKVSHLKGPGAIVQAGEQLAKPPASSWLCRLLGFVFFCLFFGRRPFRTWFPSFFHPSFFKFISRFALRTRGSSPRVANSDASDPQGCSWTTPGPPHSWSCSRGTSGSAARPPRCREPKRRG